MKKKFFLVKLEALYIPYLMLPFPNTLVEGWNFHVFLIFWDFAADLFYQHICCASIWGSVVSLVKRLSYHPGKVSQTAFRFTFNPLMPCSNKQVRHTWTNLQLKAYNLVTYNLHIFQWKICFSEKSKKKSNSSQSSSGLLLTCVSKLQKSVAPTYPERLWYRSTGMESQILIPN